MKRESANKTQIGLLIVLIAFFVVIILILSSFDVSLSPRSSGTKQEIKKGNSIDSISDENFVYQDGDIKIDIFNGNDGKKAFTVKRLSDGKFLKKSFDNDIFYKDKSDGVLDIKYDILKRVGGVDIIYTVKNPSNSPQLLPNFYVEGINHNLNGEVSMLDTLRINSGSLVKLNLSKSLFLEQYYPSLYSPVIVTEDGDFAVGTSLEYPYLNYKHWAQLKLNLLKEGVKADTWRHDYGNFVEESTDFKITPGAPSTIAAGETRNYTLNVRFAPSRYWLLTLYPYKQYFNSLYGSDNNFYDKDLRPVRSTRVADYQDQNIITNPRGYDKEYRIDQEGWGRFVDDFINESLQLGYTRTSINAPGGQYLNATHNLPPQFMSEWLPKVANTDGNFSKFEENDLVLGFYWGRSSQAPVPVQWEPDKLVTVSSAVYPEGFDFLKNEIKLASKRHAKLIILDAFITMPDTDKYWFIDEIKDALGPGAHIACEAACSDFIHAKIGNYYIPWLTDEPIQGPDLLAHYLNPGAEQFVESAVTLDPPFTYDFQTVQKLVRWGYTSYSVSRPNNEGTAQMVDVHDLDYTLIKCLDGIDNDGDGYTDYPYDLGCKDAKDNSE